MKQKNKMGVKKKSPGIQKKPKGKISEAAMADMTVDDMFSMVHDDEVDLSDNEATTPTTKQKKKAKKKKKSGGKQSVDKLEDEELGLDDDENLADVGKLSQKEYLEQLKKNDPRFYATMMQSSEVMDMRSSDEEDDSGDDEERGGAIFVPPTKLEVDSDESDAEDEGLEKRGHNVITAAKVTQWEQELTQPRPLNAFLEANQALLAAIESLRGNEKGEREATSKYKVEGPQIFNAIVRMCLKKIPAALSSILNVKNPKDDPTKTKKWSKYKNFVKAYLRHLVMLTECVAEASVAEVVLKRGVLPLLPYYAALTPTAKLLFRRLVTLWATSEKRVRVLAFICIFRLSRSLKGHFLEWALKRLYLGYVQNCRFTSPSTWGLIDFMRISLVELYALDQALGYKHAFVYIRQMAFHLRNAITVKKKERVQLVYNWQYIHCLHLWSDLLSKTHPSPALQPIIYPLTQVAIGTMKLQPTPSFYPLVFHVCSLLTEMSRHTHTFIPVLPFLLQVLTTAPLEKKHKKASIKPYDWLCMLRLSRAEMTHSAFKDGVVDQVYNGVMSYLSVHCNSIAFPELVVPATLQLKGFLKKCKVPNYTKKIRQLLEKIKENKEFIETKRREVTFGIADSKAVQDWEISVRQSGTPLDKHYQNWKKVYEKDQLRRISNRVVMDDYNLPSVKKRELLEKQKGKDNEFKGLFPSDEEDDGDDETRFLPKNERAKVRQEENKKAAKKKHSEDEDSDDFDDGQDEEGSEEEDDDVNEPPSKKMKGGEQEDIVDDNDSVISDDGVADDVREMDFSDLE